MTPQVMIITIVIIVVVVLFTILNTIESNSLFQNSNQLEQNSTSNKLYSDQLEQMQSDHLERLARVYALNQRYVTIKSYH